MPRGRVTLAGVLLGAVAAAGPLPGPPPSAEEASAVFPAQAALYLDLHRHPELSFHERETAAKLASQAAALGYEVTSGVGGTGVVAVLRNGPGRTVMLRTDMDALPVREETGLPYASTVTVKGDAGESIPVMHACGHDIHMASWIGTAALMSRDRDRWHGTLVLIGQPAEEAGAGAAAMLKDGLFTRFPKPDFALAIHDEAEMPAGEVGFHPGYFRAGADSVTITVFGRGGHGAFPHLAIDPIVIAARIVLALQTIVARENNPLDPAVVTVGTIHGGTRNNVIPEEVRMQLTVRAFKPEVMRRLIVAIGRIAKGEAAAAGAPREPTVTVDDSLQPEFNDPELADRVVGAVRTALGAGRVVEMPPQMGAEDFALYGLAGVPSVLLHVGAVDPARFAEAQRSGTPLPSIHSPQFAPAYEPTIKTATLAETAALLDLLSR